MYPYFYYPNNVDHFHRAPDTEQPLFHMPFFYRRQSIQGQATWTEGGAVTKCDIPWSDNQFMTVAVSPQSEFRCGQMLKVRNPATQREILVEVVDTVDEFPGNHINLHRRAFEALGANPGVGIVDVVISPAPDLEEEEFGKYLMEIVRVAYPGYNIVDYEFVGSEEVAENRVSETYNYVVESPQERVTVQGHVVYNPRTDRVISFDLEELE
ncbi:DUF3889 domain-containing protein [Alkalibacillus aidingensis]|uniref:DUF3889 domain-containing protein n=1 Tax=Alkalibacillus aidingensis TaxID=2747607 RepID=UPI0016603378|nr:DUF3889 domain-containing protein [Alkalibacillus aidingensis]